jgi:hypothetical protein
VIAESATTEFLGGSSSKVHLNHGRYFDPLVSVAPYSERAPRARCTACGIDDSRIPAALLSSTSSEVCAVAVHERSDTSRESAGRLILLCWFGMS